MRLVSSHLTAPRDEARDAQPNIYNDIIWGNSATYDPQLADYTFSIVVHYCCIESGTIYPWFDPITCTAQNPLFVAGDPASAMFLGTTRTDEIQDQDEPDMGFHYPVSPSPDDYYVPDDYTTIQAAINAVASGSTIIVRPGMYYENIDYGGKNVTVVSEKGPFVTVIDGNQSGSVVKFDSYESLDAVLDGFTVTNGLAGLGGGIFCEWADPTIINNVITLNTSTAAYGGGGIFCYGGSPLIENNTITENHANVSGGGIRFEECAAIVTDCYIANNTAEDGEGIGSAGFDGLIENCVVVDNTASRSGGGYAAGYYSFAAIINSVFAGNVAQSLWGGGLYLSHTSDPAIVNCTIADNTAANVGGILCYNAAPSMVNSILWDNSAPSGPEITLLFSSTLTIDYSDVERGRLETAAGHGRSIQ